MSGSIAEGQRRAEVLMGGRGQEGKTMGTEHIKEQQPTQPCNMKRKILKGGVQPGEALFQTSRHCHSQKLPCKTWVFFKSAWQLQSKFHKQVIRKYFHFVINISESYFSLIAIAWAAPYPKYTSGQWPLEVSATMKRHYWVFSPEFPPPVMQKEWCLHQSKPLQLWELTQWQSQKRRADAAAWKCRSLGCHNSHLYLASQQLTAELLHSLTQNTVEHCTCWKALMGTCLWGLAATKIFCLYRKLT